MASMVERRITILERSLHARRVRPVAIMTLPLSPEDEVRAVEHRQRGTVVLLVTEDDMRL